MQSIYAEDIKNMKPEYISQSNKLGIFDFEYTNVLFSDSELTEFLLIKKKFPGSKFFMHFYLNEKNVTKILSTPEIVHISTFIPYPHTKEHIILLQKILYSNKTLRISIEDGLALSIKKLDKIFSELKGVESIARLSFSDTFGIISPNELTSKLKEFSNNNFFKNHDIEFHFHNDRGLAVANALAIIDHLFLFQKDVYLSTSAFGIGERNGILSLQGLLANMKYLNILDEKNICHLSSFNEIFYKKNIFFDTTPLGINAFRHSATSHIMFSTENYANLNPKKFNMKNQIVIQNNLSDEIIFSMINKFYKKNTNEIFLNIKKEFFAGKKFFILNIPN